VQAERSRPQGGYGLVEPERGTPLQLDIRVAVVRNARRIQLSSTGPWWLRRADGSVLSQGGPGQAVTLDSGRLPAVELSFDTSPDAAISVDGWRYRGRLRLLQMPAGLLAVNHLPLEDYVASVVGAEMPSSWNREALKAQAVAARSYALAHMARPASRHWHLGSTTRWQAYRGLESATGRTLQATRDTSGLILSYQGGIVESLYASTTALSLEAHGHLGASMSQHGAQDLASRGLPYNQILARYYPGAALARLRSGGR
jgi:peptidoglycan hydrolase-like amidase